MFKFKDYLLIKENEEIPTEQKFNQNSHEYLMKFQKETISHFAIQIAKEVLPVWEDWARENNFTPSQQAIPRNSLDKNYGGLQFHRFILYSLGEAPPNVQAAVRAAFQATSVDKLDGTSTPNEFPDNYYHAARAGNAIREAENAGMQPQEVYNIYLKLAKTQNVQQHIQQAIPNHHLSPDIIAMIKAARQDTHSMPILADKLQDHGFNDESILSHMRDPSVKWSPNDWIFKALLGK